MTVARLSVRQSAREAQDALVNSISLVGPGLGAGRPEKAAWRQNVHGCCEQNMDAKDFSDQQEPLQLAMAMQWSRCILETTGISHTWSLLRAALYTAQC